MAILSRRGVIRLLALSSLLILPVTSGAQQRAPVVEKLAKTYGLESFGQIEAIRYTFGAQAPGLDLSRSWTWEPKTDQVTYEGKDKSGKPVKVTYLRSQLGSQSAEVKENIDPGFLNDNYWLILPFSYCLGHQRCGGRCRHAETATGQWFRRESHGEVSFRRRLFAG